MGKNQILGAKGEELVANYLISHGYKIVDRNWRIKDGEIDLIALNGLGQITFVEVKTRSNQNFGHPLEAISKSKALRLQRLALSWLVQNKRFGENYEIDCASVLILNEKFEIDYRRNVL
jgi:putative endonuclease